MVGVVQMGERLNDHGNIYGGYGSGDCGGGCKCGDDGGGGGDGFLVICVLFDSVAW